MLWPQPHRIRTSSHSRTTARSPARSRPCCDLNSTLTDSNASPRVLRWTRVKLHHAAVLYARGNLHLSSRPVDCGSINTIHAFSRLPCPCAASLRAIEALELAIVKYALPEHDQFDRVASTSSIYLSAGCVGQWRAQVPVLVVGGASADAAIAAGWSAPLGCRVRLHVATHPWIR